MLASPAAVVAADLVGRLGTGDNPGRINVTTAKATHPGDVRPVTGVGEVQRDSVGDQSSVTPGVAPAGRFAV